MILLRLTKSIFLILLILLFTACGAAPVTADIAATTGTVAQFTEAIAEGSGLTVTQVISEQISCLHDYALSVRQMEALTNSRVVLMSGAGLEETMEDALHAAEVLYDCSEGISVLEQDGHEHHEAESGHEHTHDPHIWLDPANAAAMAENICAALTAQYPEQGPLFRKNTDALVQKLEDLAAYGHAALADLSCRKLITFHDGFAYFANAFDLEIVAAIEEESGSEASAADLIHIIETIEHHQVPAIFTETNGSVSAATIIEAEIGVESYTLDMAMGGDYFSAMTHNIDTLKEALQ